MNGKSNTAPTEEPIRVASRVLIHIGAGIYSTPGNALKELISNSFDADATEVYMDTNPPLCDRVTCSDNGSGIETQAFKKIMQSIGETQKEKKEYTDKLHRPIIGKFGIGLLAVSPICKKFRVISKVEGSPFKFEAEIDLKQFRKTLRQKAGDQLGSFLLWDRIPEERNVHFTKIILEDLDPHFSEGLRTSGPKYSFPEEATESFEKPVARLRRKVAEHSSTITDFEKLIRWIANMPEITEKNLPGRDKLAWELGLLCPVRYLGSGPLIGYNVLVQTKKELSSFNFKVFLDGIELFKPALFPLDEEIREKDLDYTFSEFSYDSEKDHNCQLDLPLKFSGYIYWQRKGIMPPSLRGVLLRVKHVGVNAYDDSCLNFPELQALRLQQVSSEIFIHKGLEEAFNIDRKSFRETDPQYRLLQSYFTARLMDLFRRSYKWGRIRRDAKHQKRQKEYEVELGNFVRRITKNEFAIRYNDREASDPVTIDKQKKILNINRHPIWPRPQYERQILEGVLLCLEIARKTFSEQDWYRRFLEFVEQLYKGRSK
jgi:hypothetical protein